jgi:hypothetical protein
MVGLYDCRQAARQTGDREERSTLRYVIGLRHPAKESRQEAILPANFHISD